MKFAAPSKSKDAAYEFVKYVTDVPAAKVLALQGRQSPANKAVYSDAQVSKDPILKAWPPERRKGLRATAGPFCFPLARKLL